MRALLRGPKGGYANSTIFCQKSQRIQISSNVSFPITQNSGLGSQKSQNLTHGTQESQTFPQSICQRSKKRFTFFVCVIVFML